MPDNLARVLVSGTRNLYPDKPRTVEVERLYVFCPRCRTAAVLNCLPGRFICECGSTWELDLQKAEVD